MRKPICLLAGATPPHSAAGVPAQAAVGSNPAWAGIGADFEHMALNSALTGGRCIAAMVLIGVEAM
ncbi:MAG TPA: hypothetical protein VET87_10900 [Rubrivivax sp.]|nr:hypothetical protein [Rubrivivax sp.]